MILLANKRVRAVQIVRWLGILADELAERCVDDEWEHRRRPKSLGAWRMNGCTGAGLSRWVRGG